MTGTRRLLRPRRRRRAICSPGQSSCGNPFPARRSQPWWRISPAGWPGGQSREVTFTPWGGAYNRVGADATAFVHRDELFLVQHLLLIDPSAQTTSGGSLHEWLTRSWALVHPWGAGGVYPNFPDPDRQDWAQAITGRTTNACYG
jgi:hypothetical protein